MKRFISIVLAFVLVATTLPIGTLASESKENTEDVVDAMINKACEVFPEYAHKMTGRSNATRTATCQATPPEIVVSLNRSISETESMTYTEYSDGVVLLSSEKYDCEYSYSVDQALPTSISYTMTITATCISPEEEEYPGYFRLSNLKYTILFNGYDSITDIGTPTYGEGCISRHTTHSETLREGSGYPAMLRYYIQFNATSQSGDFYGSTVTFRLQNDTFSVSHQGGTP